VGDLSTLIPDFERSLKAGNKSAQTVRIYGNSVRSLADFLNAQGMPTAAEQVGREHIEAFTADQLARSSRPPHPCATEPSRRCGGG